MDGRTFDSNDTADESNLPEKWEIMDVYGEAVVAGDSRSAEDGVARAGRGGTTADYDRSAI